MDLKERSDRLNERERSDRLILGKQGYWHLRQGPLYRAAHLHHLAQEIGVMQIHERSAELGKVVGLNAEPMLFRGFNGELTQAQERTGDRVRRSPILHQFQPDPPPSLRITRLPPGGSSAVAKRAR